MLELRSGYDDFHGGAALAQRRSGLTDMEAVGAGQNTAKVTSATAKFDLVMPPVSDRLS